MGDKYPATGPLQYQWDGEKWTVPSGQPARLIDAPADGTVYGRNNAMWVHISAADVTFTPTGNLASATVQNALQEMDGEKVAKAGDTMTGNLNIQVAQPKYYLLPEPELPGTGPTSLPSDRPDAAGSCGSWTMPRKTAAMPSKTSSSFAATTPVPPPTTQPQSFNGHGRRRQRWDKQLRSHRIGQRRSRASRGWPDHRRFGRWSISLRRLCCAVQSGQLDRSVNSRSVLSRQLGRHGVLYRA